MSTLSMQTLTLMLHTWTSKIAGAQLLFAMMTPLPVGGPGLENLGFLKEKIVRFYVFNVFRFLDFKNSRRISHT